MWRTIITAKFKPAAILVLLHIILVGGCGSSPETSEWKTRAFEKDVTTFETPDGEVLIGRPSEANECVRICMVDTLCKKHQCRIVAVSRNGRTYLGTQKTRFNRNRNCRSTVAMFPNVNLEDIEQFEFQTRPREKETDPIDTNSKLSNAVRKRRLVDQFSQSRPY
ncbi:MAG: hypothetical protein JW720_03750 [Sedimentisphaerales bacterium]|nr:hypothetical protein [Sedimentisphaerales bacterium]